MFWSFSCFCNAANSLSIASKQDLLIEPPWTRLNQSLEGRKEMVPMDGMVVEMGWDKVMWCINDGGEGDSSQPWDSSRPWAIGWRWWMVWLFKEKVGQLHEVGD